MIDQIIKNKIPCYFISPHLDDAIFSAGGLLDKLSGKVDLTVINVFTTAGDAKNTLSAKAYLKQCASADPVKLFKERLIEDKAALSTWKIKVVDLHYADAMWRKFSSRNFGLPELTSNYPTYRFHVISGRVSRFDNPLMIDLANKLKSIIKEKDYYVFCPVGFGNHADHLLVRDVCHQTFAANRVFYWSDFPYYFRNRTGGKFIQNHKLDSFEVKHNGVKKTLAAKLYKTQFSAVVADPNTLKNPETYYHNLVALKPKLTLKEKINNHLFALIKYPKDYLFSFTYRNDKSINIKPYNPQVKKTALALIAKIKKQLPRATPELIGSTGLGIAGQGDIDLLIPTHPRNFTTYTTALTKLFGKPEKLGTVMIQWKLQIEGIAVDLDLIDDASPRYNEQSQLFNMLRTNTTLLSRYESFKWKMNGVSIQEYDRAQIKFFHNIIRDYIRSISLHSSLPSTIGGYTLIKEVLKDKKSQSYLYGTYQNALGKMAFAKVWIGSKYNHSYKELLNEINLYQKLSSTPDVGPRLPGLIHTIIHPDLLVLLLEYAEGISPDNLDVPAQLRVYTSVINRLTQLGDSLKTTRGIKVRKPLFWATLFPVIAVMSLLKNPKSTRLIFAAIKSFYGNIMHFLLNTQVVLTHRDLGKWNILSNTKITWFYDLQLMGLMHPVIEKVVLNLKLWGNKELITSLWQSALMQNIINSNSELRLFKSYSIVFGLYDLAQSNGGDKKLAHSYLEAIMKINPKPSRSPKIHYGVKLIFLMFAFVLMLSLRGNYGNSTPATLNTPTWKENGPFELSPERGRFALTYSLIEDKSFYFSTDLARFVTPDLGYHNGHYVSLFAPGVSYLVMPGYLIGKYFGASQLGAFSIIAIFALCNSMLIYALVKRFGGSKVAGLIAGGVFLFATPAYAYGVNLYQHHISSFLILASLYLVLSYNNWLSLTLVWLLCATSIPVDYPNLVLMLPIGIYALSHLLLVKVDKSTIITLKVWRLFTLFSMLLPLAFFLWFNNRSYGNPLQFSGTVQSVGIIDANGNPASAYTNDKELAIENLKEEKHEKTAVGFFKSRNLLNGLYILLLSPDRGLLYFAPILLLSLLGGYVLYQSLPSATVLLSSVVLFNILLYSLWGDPWGGWAYGARYLIPSYGVLAVFLGSALSRYGKKLIFLITFLVLVSYSLYINTAGALSTSANPPQVQVLSLEQLSGRRERYSFDRNLEYIKQNSSKSFFYRVVARKYMTPWQYFQLISSSLIALSVIGGLVLYFGHREPRS